MHEEGGAGGQAETHVSTAYATGASLDAGEQGGAGCRPGEGEEQVLR